MAMHTILELDEGGDHIVIIDLFPAAGLFRVVTFLMDDRDIADDAFDGGPGELMRDAYDMAQHIAIGASPRLIA